MATVPSGGNGSSTLDPGDFQELIAAVRPRSEELRWRKNPWQTDLREACRLAAEQRKPIFLWAMNANPLSKITTAPPAR